MLDVLQYGYLGLLGLMLYFCYKIISNFQNSNKPFGQTVILILLFLAISVLGGSVGYLWASKELQVAEAKESSVSIIKGQVEAARKKLERNTQSLNEAQAKALEEANNTYKLDSYREAAMKRAKQIAEFINEQEEDYQKELHEIRAAFDGR